MTPIFKIILVVSFIGLVVIVAKNRFANPEMRVRFLEDIERNKKRMKKFFNALSHFGDTIGEKLTHGIKASFPLLKRGSILLVQSISSFTSRFTSKMAEHAKELKQDMKEFEVTKNKEDFLERLEGEIGKKEEEQKSKEETPVHRSAEEISSRELPETFLQEKRPHRMAPIRAQETTREREVRGFRVSPISQGTSSPEGELDKDILEQKEKWLLYAIAKNPKNPNFYKKLGRIYLQMNSLEDAKNCFEYALKLGSQDPEIRSLLTEIKRSLHSG